MLREDGSQSPKGWRTGETDRSFMNNRNYWEFALKGKLKRALDDADIKESFDLF